MIHINTLARLARFNLRKQCFAVQACVIHDLKERHAQGVLENLTTSVNTVSAVSGNLGGQIDQCHTATSDDTFRQRCLGCRHGVVNTELLFVNLGFGRATNLDYRNLTAQRCNALVELLFIIATTCVIGLCGNLLRTRLDISGRTGTFNNRRLIFTDDLLARRTNNLKTNVFKRQATVFGDNGCTR